MPSPILPSSLPLLFRAAFKRAGPPPAPGSALVRTSFCATRLDQSRLARYNRALGFPDGSLPVTFYYLLAQRAHLASLLLPGVPFRIAGMIHVANELAEQNTPSMTAPLDLRTVVTTGAEQAGGAVHLLLQTRGEQDGRAIFTCSSDYLAVRGARGTGHPAAHAPDTGAGLGRWSLNASDGRAYAAVSGDWNPIHLWPWSARLLGMHAPIIHGMHTVGRACALLEARGGRPVASISARFTAPISLPADVAMTADLAACRYSVQSGGRVAVAGDFGWATATANRTAA